MCFVDIEGVSRLASFSIFFSRFMKLGMAGLFFFAIGFSIAISFFVEGFFKESGVRVVTVNECEVLFLNGI